jgi:hypothetical protein
LALDEVEPITRCQVDAARALRHTHATRMWEAGMRELTLQRRLGHASPEATRVYTRVSDPIVVAAATTSWPPWRRMATVFDPISPVPPITTIFIAYPPSSLSLPGPVIRTTRTSNSRQLIE